MAQSKKIIIGLAVAAVLVTIFFASRGGDGSEPTATGASATTSPSATPSSSAPSTPSSSPDEEFEVVFEITKACAQTVHRPLNGFPSQIKWTFDAPGLPDGTTVEVRAGNATSIEATVTDGKVTVSTGIPSYGNYHFPTVSWTDEAGVENSIDVDREHTVDAREGQASETCAS